MQVALPKTDHFYSKPSQRWHTSASTFFSSHERKKANASQTAPLQDNPQEKRGLSAWESVLKQIAEHIATAFQQALPEAPASPESTPLRLLQQVKSRTASLLRIPLPCAPLPPTSLSPIEVALPYPVTLLSRKQVQPEQPLAAIKPLLLQAKNIALGDLHGCYQKLVETALMTGMATMPASQQHHYLKATAELKTLVDENGSFSNLPRARQLESQLIQAVKSLKWTGGERQLILIGDIVADRGLLDSVTLAALATLRKQAPPGKFIALASNHDADALGYWFGKGSLALNNVHSLTRAVALTNNNPTKLKALQQQYAKHFKHLKLFHYAPQSETFYTHAPMEQKQMNQFAQKLLLHFGLPELADAAQQQSDTLLADTIQSPQGVSSFVEAANQAYQHYIEQKLASQPVNPALDKLFVKVVSHRKAMTDSIPFMGRGIKTYVHGHYTEPQKVSPHQLLVAAEVDTEPQDLETIVVTLDQKNRKANEPEHKQWEATRLYAEF